MILQGNCIEVLKTLDSESVNCCVTSPPYYMLRDYGVEGQIGLEKTPEEYINKLTKVFHEVMRVLKPDGTLWVNIADTYVGTGGDGRYESICRMKQIGLKPKDLIGIPWMLAFALRADGWYLRQDIVWNKSNAMPESVQDRCTKAHEYIFLLSKSSRYYFDFRSIKEPCVGFNHEPPAGSEGTLKPNSRRRKGNNKTFRGGGAYTNNHSFDNSGSREKISIGNIPNETGLRNKRSVWTVGSNGYKDAHFATFPEKLIEPCILAGCPGGGIVIDPFLGSGTTGKVAIANGRDFIGIELKPDYCKMAQERTDTVQIKMSGETVWLSLDQMADLFQRDKSTISRHIKNIFGEGELDRNSVVANFATTAADGKVYQVDYYNLDVVISVGYRIKSLRGTQFRIWANSVRCFGGKKLLQSGRTGSP